MALRQLLKNVMWSSVEKEIIRPYIHTAAQEYNAPHSSYRWIAAPALPSHCWETLHFSLGNRTYHKNRRK
ncbi:hypothetical protein BDB00DRAFT_821593 [Zychaea mexicana]|uniref:uncharacterized protein n=1 Tax=Zychaea mexicana TaxID=64656 RepID=UPI0022FE54B2|nr:uncharacterized protein BDB00DRAFT_821593 [Zychaea mexicana]KAI9493777.1 hypothetical protein BDB00DRAFT_821593 [Zychaea mexicana]